MEIIMMLTQSINTLNVIILFVVIILVIVLIVVAAGEEAVNGETSAIVR
jgi:hypothetical protein